MAPPLWNQEKDHDNIQATTVVLGQDIPTPSRGKVRAILPTLTAVKAMLYQGMKTQGIGKAELARRVGWHLPQVDRVLDVGHHSRLDQMDTALEAIGQRLHVTVK